MDIWIIQDGEKTGPIHDFEVRRRIEKGELHADTPVWHEGLPTWQPLQSISLFEHEFDKPIEISGIEDPYQPPVDTGSLPPPLPTQTFIYRRFWARWCDLHLYSAIWWFALWLAGRNIGDLMMDPWISMLHYIPWFALEAFLIHRFGTTPGKWLLDLSVVNPDGGNLNLTESIRRASRVMFFGIGLGWYLLTLICQVMAFVTTRRLGKSLWDQAGGHQVIGQQVQAPKAFAFVLVFFRGLHASGLRVASLLPRSSGRGESAIQEGIPGDPRAALWQAREVINGSSAGLQRPYASRATRSWETDARIRETECLPRETQTRD